MSSWVMKISYRFMRIKAVPVEGADSLMFDPALAGASSAPIFLMPFSSLPARRDRRADLV